MIRPIRFLILILLTGAVLSPLPAQGCTGQGNATLFFPVGTLGGAWTPALAASPGAVFNWYVDVAPGTFTFPAGTVCLGLTPQLLTLWDGLAGAPAMPGNGMLSLALQLPLTPALLGVTLYSQFITIDPLAPNGLGISNPQSLQLALTDFSLPTATPLASFGTSLHRAVPLQDDRYTLIIGGGSGTLIGPTPSANTEIYDHFTRTFLVGPVMNIPRVLHTATRLGDGRVLVTGGLDSTTGNVASAEIYDPVSNTWTMTVNNMRNVRAAHAATLLADGRVLITGGNGVFATAANGSFTPVFQSGFDTTDIFDPTTNSFINGPQMIEKRIGHSAVLLPDLRVLVAGGITDASPILPIFPAYTVAGEIWNPATNTFTPTGVTPNDRFVGTMDVLPNGDVLFAGGAAGGLMVSTNTADLWVSASNSWTILPSNMPVDVALAATARLANGSIAIIGGGQGSVALNTAVDQVVVYNPSTFTFTMRAPLGYATGSHTVSPLPDGSFLVVGGVDPMGFASTTAHIWTP